MLRFRILWPLVAAVVLALPVPLRAQPPGTDIHLAPLSIDANGITVGAPRNLTARAGYDNQPSFGPDGGYLLYTAADTSGATDVHRYDLGSGRITRLTDTPESEYSPTVLPDGTGFSTVRVEADGAQRLWAFDLDGTKPRLVLAAVDSVGYHAWLDEGTLGLFVLGDPHTLRLATVTEDADRLMAADIGRCLARIPGTGKLSFVQNEGDVAWIVSCDPATGEFTRLVRTLPDRQDYTWLPVGGLLMADGSVLFWWSGDGEWQEVVDFAEHGLVDITRLAVSPDGKWLAVVAAER